jgi:hypothetical protein
MGETNEIAYVDLPPTCTQSKGKPLSITMFKRSYLTHVWSKGFYSRTVERAFSIRVERTYFGDQKSTNRCFVNCLNLQIIPAKLSRSAKQHPSNSAHLKGADLCGVCRYIVTNSSLLLTSEPNSRRVPRVGRVWLAQAHTQAAKHSKYHRQRDASLKVKWDLAPPQSQSPSHVYNVQCLSKRASCAFLLAYFPKTSPVPAA